MKDGYADNLTLDRIDSNGNYCKDNCRWATPTEQQHNRILLTTVTKLEWADEFNIKKWNFAQGLNLDGILKQR